MISDPPAHPARRLRYDELIDGLEKAREDGLVSCRRLGDHAIWCYTPACVYDRGWDEFTLLARGLILDERKRRVVATPFPKFFNLDERGDEALPDDEGFAVYEKLDGSLIILWHDGECWRTATKGSLDSEQSRAAAVWLEGKDLSPLLLGHTYLAEYVGPGNRIVVSYAQEELVLLGIYDDRGYESNRLTVERLGDRLGWRVARRYEFASLADLVAHAATLPATDEGFVLHFHGTGVRLKVKGEEYRRIHALISRCTPLAIWEAMKAGDNLVMMIRDDLPDEFLEDFDRINGLLTLDLISLKGAVAMVAEGVRDCTDKEIGLRLDEFPERVRRFIFPYRKSGGDLLAHPKTREALFRAIRPTGNALPGYTPSYAMKLLWALSKLPGLSWEDEQ